MDETNDLLFKLYQEEVDQCLKNTELRVKTTGLVLTITAGLTAIISFDKVVTYQDLPIIFFLILIGLVFVVSTMKQHERFSFHMFRSREYLYRLESNIKDLNITATKEIADKKLKKKHPYLSRLKLKYLWALLSLMPSFIGIVFLLILYSPNNV